MIYGCMLIAPGGSLLYHKFYDSIRDIQTDLSLISNGLYAIQSFFKTVFGTKIDRVVSNEIKMTIQEDSDLILALISDINDNMDKVIARKYIKRLVSRIKEKNIAIYTLIDSMLSDIKDIIDELNREIIELNARSREVRYI